MTASNETSTRPLAPCPHTGHVSPGRVSPPQSYQCVCHHWHIQSNHSSLHVFLFTESIPMLSHAEPTASPPPPLLVLLVQRASDPANHVPDPMCLPVSTEQSESLCSTHPIPTRQPEPQFSPPLLPRLPPTATEHNNPILLLLLLLLTTVLTSRADLAPHYINYNLADYCSEQNWSDYPGRHRIRLEKSVKIRRPTIVDFQYNETHRFWMGDQPLWTRDEIATSASVTFAPYCLLSIYADHGYRIYAEGFATGLMSDGKDWFTETLHFRSTDSPTGTGTFSISTHKSSLSLVFEQLHLKRFGFHLLMTPFRDELDLITGCDSHREYRCTNGRCIASYLTCDHHNNCGDHSDEATNCLWKVTTGLPNGKGGPGEGQETDENGLPVFHINNRLYPPFRPTPSGEPGGKEDIPEYVDVPLPTDVHLANTTRDSNGFRGAGPVGGVTNGGLLEDLFRFDRETSNVVKVVRYLLAILLIIILVTLVNFLIWCLITKSEETFMAPQGAPPPPPATPTVFTI